MSPGPSGPMLMNRWTNTVIKLLIFIVKCDPTSSLLGNIQKTDHRKAHA